MKASLLGIMNRFESLRAQGEMNHNGRVTQGFIERYDRLPSRVELRLLGIYHPRARRQRCW